MHINCPHCNNPIEVVEQERTEEVICPSCGSSISVEPKATAGWSPKEGTRKLGKYELIDTVGVGAFGTVYMARDTELDRMVAVKVPRAGNLTSGEDLDRFLREARSAAQLRHPSIVSVHDVGQENGLPYLVSDFIRGTTLADLFSVRRPSHREAVELIVTVADALQYAHRQGVVHRDVKPSNIMLDDDGTPRLMDFGLAKRDAGEITMTLDGQVLGTPAYMSPEQAKGESHKVDGRSDVYSLGVVLYELLTGELPFRGTKRMLIYQVANDEPRAPRSLNDHIPRDLDTICLKCLEKEPNRRYGSAQELAEDLKRFLRQEPIVARPIGTTGRLWRWCKRNPLASSLSVTLALALLSGLGGTTSQWLRAEKEKGLAFRHLYVARMNLAQQAYGVNNLTHAKELLELCREGGRRDDIRGFEWFYWWRLCHLDLWNFSRHSGHVTSVVYSPDGKTLVTGSKDRFIRLFDLKTGMPMLTLVGHTAGIQSLAFSPDGTTIASGSSDHSVCLWDARKGELKATLSGHLAPVSFVAFSSDGKSLASASEDKTTRIWNTKSGELIHTLAGHDGPVRSAAFISGRDHSQLVTTSDDHTVGLWSLESGRLESFLNGHDAPVLCVACSSDGKLIASGSADDTVKIWDARTTHQKASIRPEHGDVFSVSFSADCMTLTTGCADGTISQFNVATTRFKGVLARHFDSVLSIAHSPDGLTLASGSKDRTARVWRADRLPPTDVLEGHSGAVLAVAFSPQDPIVASGGVDKTIRLWDVTTGTLSATLHGHTDAIRCVAFSADGTTLASGASDNTIRLWNPKDGSLKGVLRNHTEPVLGIAFSPDGQVLASASLDETVRIWDVEKGQERTILRGQISRVYSVAFSPDGELLATGGADPDRPVLLWNPANYRAPIAALGDRNAGSYLVAFSPDGTVLASGGWYGTVTLRDVSSGKVKTVLRGHSDEVRAVVFFPDGQTLATASSDGTVRLWDVATGQSKATLKGHTDKVRALARSQDGRTLCSASSDGTLRIWRTATEVASTHRTNHSPER